MSKYLLHPNHINDTIITKVPDGSEAVVTKNTFDDYFAECMLRSGQGHLIIQNADYAPDTTEKKSFDQIGENAILLTSTVEQIGKSEQNQTVKEPESNLSDGELKQKRAYKKRNS